MHISSLIQAAYENLFSSVETSVEILCRTSWGLLWKPLYTSWRPLGRYLWVIQEIDVELSMYIHLSSLIETSGDPFGILYGRSLDKNLMRNIGYCGAP